MKTRLLFSQEAEVAVLGGMLIDRDAVDIAASLVKVEWFYLREHGLLFRAMLSIHARGDAIDPITLSQELKRTDEFERAGGMDYLAGLVDAVPTAANLEYHAEIVRDNFQLRSLFAACTETIEAVLNDTERNTRELLDDVEARLLQVGDIENGTTATDLRQSVSGVLRRIEKRQGQKGLPGISTGFPDLDHMTGGFQPGELIVVAGRPSMGKTSWAISVARTAAGGTGKASAILTLEQGTEELEERILAAEARVDLLDARMGRCSPEDLQRLRRAEAALSRVPILIEDQPGNTILEVRSRARRLARRHDLGLIVLDYLQLLGGGSEGRVQEVSAISRGLKLLAKELAVPIIAVSQLSRGPEQRPDKRPHLSDLRDSGSIEQDADVVLFLYRPEYYAPPEQKLALEGAAELIVAKQRNGPTGTIPLHFVASCARFDSIQRGGA